ncbi:hypothetical protein [Gordonia soli]|uniref:ESX-1 secretion-associated protein n=1 Tax=Gordonia soli NBRC 108243 TaxID=1223545 RepID=M0QJH2_9ACTN|nr:hypothetical protein [Gordonia soli]GAC68604.1 hypothetical protein GS4_16_01350 [Gordonia soli NBRC 108243]
MPPGPRPPAPTKFGIDGEQITATANTWSAQGRDVTAISLAAMSSVIGSSSKVMDELRATPAAAQPTVRSIGSRLTTMGANLQKFKGQVEQDDQTSATKFRNLPSR